MLLADYKAFLDLASSSKFLRKADIEAYTICDDILHDEAGKLNLIIW
jgi:hypothetical protein